MGLVMLIKPYEPRDEAAVIELWHQCGLLRPWNNPRKDIERKLKVNPELFLVGLIEDRVVATVMGGYEGRRGWVNYLAVAPEYRRRGLGLQIMAVVEEKLRGMGCPKINLQIRWDNQVAVDFYKKAGYKIDEVVSMGKRLIEDEPFFDDEGK